MLKPLLAIFNIGRDKGLVGALTLLIKSPMVPLEAPLVWRLDELTVVATSNWFGLDGGDVDASH